MTLDHLVPELGSYEKPNRVDPLAYLDSTMRETIQKFQEMEKSKREMIRRTHEDRLTIPRMESILDLLPTYESPLKDMEIFTRDVMQRAHEMAVEQPRALQHNQEMIIEQQNQIIAKLSEQNELLKNKLEHLENLKSMDTNLEKIAIQTEKEQITPEYVTKLIEAGLLDTEWKATKGLPKIIKFLHEDWKMDHLEPGIFQQFKKRTGEPFSLKTIQEEIKRVKNS